MARLYSPGNVYITTSIGHPWPVEQVIKIFSIRVPLDDLTTILVILRETDEEINCVSVFQNQVTLWMVRIWLRNRPAKLLVKSANKNTELHISLYSTYLHHDAWWFYYYYYWMKYDSTCKGSEQTWIKHFSHVWLCCDCRAACGSRIQGQLRSCVAHMTADAESRLP